LVSALLLLPPLSCFPMQLRFHRHLWCQLSCLHLPSYKLHWVHLSPSSLSLPCLHQKAYSGGFQALSAHLGSSEWGTRASRPSMRLLLTYLFLPLTCIPHLHIGSTGLGAQKCPQVSSR
jgi:hypothetical protein